MRNEAIKIQNDFLKVDFVSIFGKENFLIEYN